MTASLATLAELDWIVALLARRRRPLVSYAPIFWRPAPDASTHHRAYLEYLLIDGGAHAYRTPASVLIAVPRGDGWLVDDAFVPGEDWAGDGRVLWDALAADCGGSEVRFVCPTYERARADFARAAGLTVAETWWLMELPGSGGGEAGAQIELPGAGALTVGAPAVYAPPGPILFLPALTDAERAVPAVDETPGDHAHLTVTHEADEAGRLDERIYAAAPFADIIETVRPDMPTVSDPSRALSQPRHRSASR